jgi:hypothetical protein
MGTGEMSGRMYVTLDKQPYGDRNATRCLKFETVDPEETAVAMQRLGEHVPPATNTHTTTEELLEAALSTWSLPRLYNKNKCGYLTTSEYKKLRGIRVHCSDL